MPKTPLRSLSDEELLNLYYDSRDSQWLGHLLQRYTLMLLGVCLKYLKQEEAARDSVQQVFLKVIPELDKYRVTYFKSWIYQIAKNHCLMQLREQKKWGVTIPADEVPIAGDVSVDADFWQTREAQFQQLSTALQLLGAEQRRCVTLFYLEKQSYRQISATTGYAVPLVKSYIQNGKRNLRIALKQTQKEDRHER